MASAKRRAPEPVLETLLAPEQVPWHWQAAPLPEAELWGWQAGRLQRLAGGAPVLAASAELGAALQPPAGGNATPVVAAGARGGAVWRLRRCAGLGPLQLWWAQPLERSRSLLFTRLRSSLGRVLAGGVQHNLRGPLQTLTFNADIAARLFEAGRGDGRYLDNIATIKRCVRDLELRQTAAVELWLAPPEATAPASVQELLEQAAALLRGHLALAGVKLLAQDWTLLQSALVHSDVPSARIAVLALLLLAGTGACGRQAELRADARNDSGTPVLDLDAPAAGAALAPEFAPGEAVAAVALLLDSCGLQLQPPGAAALCLRCPVPGAAGAAAQAAAAGD